ncbi:MFS transporter [Pelagibius sp. Alg239-R121]|uniref:MFS transporter n=1 Tax=Pelagibius sp. Alg239-R121 TaxID=2993448 RepID=UPI0024A6790F|nr:MFS transporter [Pelagibius sp. Alg239-R121]
MPGQAGFGGVVRTLQHRNFRIYITGASISLIGTWMQRVAVGWLTWELTESGFWLGLVSCADLLPAVFVGPFGGVVADRYNRLKIMLTAQTVSLFQAIALFALTASGQVTVELLALLVLINGIAMGFNQPSRLALMPSLVPREDLSTGIAINSIIFNLARFIGPAMAGLLIVSVGVQGAFGANALTFSAFLIALFRIKVPRRPDRGKGKIPPSIWVQLGEGITYAARHPGIGPMLLLLATASLGVRPFVELMPGFAARVFGGGADTLALLTSTVGIGAVMSGLWIARRGGGGLTKLVLLNTLLLALSMLAFIATDWLWIGVASVAVAGMAMVAAGVSMQTLMQMSVDGDLRGRVLSLYGIIFIGGPAAGSLIMGTLSESFGLRLPLGVGAVAVVAMWLWIWRKRASISEALEPKATKVKPGPDQTETGRYQTPI